MKKLIVFTLLIFIFNLATSQEIKIRINEVDEFNGTRTIATSPSTGNDFKLDDFIDVDGTLIINAFYSKDKEGNGGYFINLLTTRNKPLGCLSEHDGKCILLFDNGETLELTQISSTNCDRTYVYATYDFYSRDQISDPAINDIVLKNYEKIRTTPVKKIRIYGTESIADFTLKDDKKDILIKHFRVINESK